VPAEALQAAGARGGLAIVVGCKKAGLLQLGRNERLLVRGYDRHREVVRAARKRLRYERLYGRVSVALLEETRLPLADELANLLVVSEDARGLMAEELLRVLAPRGVVVANARAVPDLPSPGKRLSGGWVMWRKPVSSEIDEWTHFRYSAQGDMVLHDLRVGPPRRLQWLDEPLFQRHHGVRGGTSGASGRGRVSSSTRRPKGLSACRSSGGSLRGMPSTGLCCGNGTWKAGARKRGATTA